MHLLMRWAFYIFKLVILSHWIWCSYLVYAAPAAIMDPVLFNGQWYETGDLFEQQQYDIDDDFTTRGGGTERLSSAATCLVAGVEYTHGQQITRTDRCEFCLCLDGEMFCWWQGCPLPAIAETPLCKGGAPPFTSNCETGSQNSMPPAAHATVATTSTTAATTSNLRVENRRTSAVLINRLVDSAKKVEGVLRTSTDHFKKTTNTNGQPQQPNGDQTESTSKVVRNGQPFETTVSTLNERQSVTLDQDLLSAAGATELLIIDMEPPNTTTVPAGNDPCTILGRVYQPGEKLPHATGNCVECVCQTGGKIKCLPNQCAPEGDDVNDYRPPDPHHDIPY